jgi:hypothetical protein
VMKPVARGTFMRSFPVVEELVTSAEGG